MEIVLLGHMGRDEATAECLAEHKLHILGQWENPGLVDKAETSGGSFQLIDSITNVEAVADYIEAIGPDMFWTNFDDALAAGVVNAIQKRVANKQIPDFLIPCPNQSASRIEWDKFYLREIVQEIDPGFNPANFMAESAEAVVDAIDYFEATGKQIALKPRNLTGGKGVKVQGKHFETYMEGREYALQVLAADNQQGVEVQEKLEGHEFTLQLFTDGQTLIRPPTTYDYPYREDGDVGPGTGGMGAFSMRPAEQLPFIVQDDYDQALELMEKLLGALNQRSHDYKGILYPTFFKTADGLKIVEVNARGGDPELINILDLLEDNVDFGEVLKSIADGDLKSDSVRYKNMASAMLYLVSPDYGYGQGESYEFEMRDDVIENMGCNIRFAAAERIDGNKYRTVGSSRAVGMSALGPTPWEARDKIQDAIKEGFKQPLSLHFRQQVAAKDYIKGLVL